MTDGHPPSPYPHEPDEKARRHLRRVVIEDRQQKTLDHARMRGGFADDVSPHAHDKATFKLIRQRKELDELTGSDFVVPTLDQWKHWTRMDDWDSRNRLLEQLIEKMRRRSATEGEVEFLIVVTRPAWSGVARRLRRYGGVDLDPRAEGAARRQEAARVNDLDRAELDQIVQDALMRVLVSCPIPLPQRFFGWLKETLAHRALDYIAEDLGDEPDLLPHDPAIVDLLNKVFSDREHAGSAIFAAPASPNHSEWFRTLDVSAMFSLAEEYATYARTASACEKAVHRLPRRQRDVIERHYYRSMTQAQIAEDDGLAPSTVRNSHRGALKNLQDDDALFEVLSAVGKVRDLDRKRALEARDLAA